MSSSRSHRGRLVQPWPEVAGAACPSERPCWNHTRYDAAERVTQAKTHAGQIVTYEYDEGGRLIKVTNPLNGTTQFTYDANDQMLTIRDARGVDIVVNEYDEDGRVSKQTLPDGGYYRLNYTEDSNGNIIQTDITDPRGVVRRIGWNLNGYFSGGYPVSHVMAAGLPEQMQTTLEWDSQGSRLSAVIDGQGRKISFAYDSNGRLSTVTRLPGTTNATSRSFTYEPNYGLRATVADELSRVTSYSYDGAGRLTGITDPSNSTYNVTSNSAGQITGITAPGLGTATAEYTGGLISALIDPLGNRTTFSRDQVGRLMAVSNPLGKTTRLEYDTANQLKKVIDATQGQTQFGYNAAGGLTSVTDARNGLTGFVINAAGYTTGRTDPLLRSETFEYDKNGNRTKWTDRKGQITTATYDALNRPKVITFHDGSTITYTYDSLNRVSQIVDSVSGTNVFTYDAHNRLASESGPKGTVSYGYDSGGRRTSMTVTGQATVSYSYNSSDQLTQLTEGTTTVSATYDSYRRLATLTLPGQVVCSLGYDSLWRVNQLAYSRVGIALGSLNYDYDAAGRITSVSGGLASTVLPPASTGSYDAANQLLQWNGTALSYDPNGNVLSDGTNTYSWDARNQLSGVTAVGISAGFSYDAGGRRLQRTVNGTSVGYLHDGVNVVQELAGSTPTATLLHGPAVDALLYRTDGSGGRVPLFDIQGSVVGLVDGNGVVPTRYSYEAFGLTEVSGAASSNGFRYTGREADGTGLYYFRARYYHPGLRRFISEDPVGFAGGDVNLHAYVGNSPTNAVDPMGTSLFLSAAVQGYRMPNPLMMVMSTLAMIALRGVQALTAAKMVGSPDGGSGDPIRTEGDSARLQQLFDSRGGEPGTPLERARRALERLRAQGRDGLPDGLSRQDLDYYQRVIDNAMSNPRTSDVTRQMQQVRQEIVNLARTLLQ